MAELTPAQLRAAAAIVEVRGNQAGMSHLVALSEALTKEANHRQKEVSDEEEAHAQ